jgi:hypothetical protein
MRNMGGKCAARFQMCPGSCPALPDSLLDAPGSADQDRCHERVINTDQESLDTETGVFDVVIDAVGRDG